MLATLHFHIRGFDRQRAGMHQLLSHTCQHLRKLFTLGIAEISHRLATRLFPQATHDLKQGTGRWGQKQK
ncbi:hypothetical protein D9M71_762370 [compost metagenome]